MDAVGGGEDFSSEREEILQLLRHNRLVLPGVPEVANRIRQAVADPASSVAKVGQIIGADPALSAHLVKVANSVAYRRGDEIRNVRMAVMRLGLRLTAMTATGFSIMQMMAMAPGQQARVRALYQHSVAVAERCFALAHRVPGLVAEDALLLGLVHDIGTLPVLQYARQRRELERTGRLEGLIHAVHAAVGAELLRSWRFPELLVTAVEAHEDWQRGDPSDKPDYADLLLAANLDLRRGGDHPLGQCPGPVPALARLGLSAERPLAEQVNLGRQAGAVRDFCGAE